MGKFAIFAHGRGKQLYTRWLCSVPLQATRTSDVDVGPRTSST